MDPNSFWGRLLGVARQHAMGGTDPNAGSPFSGGGAIGPMNPTRPGMDLGPQMPVPINRGYGGEPFAPGGGGGMAPRGNFTRNRFQSQF